MVMAAILRACLGVLLAFCAAPAVAERALPGGACPVTLEGADWSDAERWAWARICAGDVANMKSFAGDRGDCNPARMTDPVPGGRILSADFLRVILTHDRYVQALAKPQVYIQCARVDEQIDLDKEVIAPQVGFWSSHLTGQLDLLGARFDRTLYLNGSVLDQGLRGDGVRIGGSLFLQDATVTG